MRDKIFDIAEDLLADRREKLRYSSYCLGLPKGLVLSEQATSKWKKLDGLFGTEFFQSLPWKISFVEQIKNIHQNIFEKIGGVF